MIDEKCALAFIMLNDRLIEKLKEKRAMGEMSIADFIRKTGISQSNVFEWLRGDHPLTKYETLWRACYVLKVKMG